jgi:serine acetyltransferase
MFKTLKEDIQNIFAKDPAAKNTLEVILLFRHLTIYANM